MPGLHRRDIQVDAVFDIECGDWTEFVVGGIFTPTKGTELFDSWEEDDLVSRLLSIDGAIWAHFGGGYDLKWLVDKIVEMHPELQIDMQVAGSRIVVARVKKAVFFDSYALVPISLEKLTSGLSVRKESLGLPCVCCADCPRHGRTECLCINYCGGYCSISRKMPTILLNRTKEYLRADLVSLWNALQSLRVFAEENDIDLGPTVGSSAWRNAKRLIGLEDADYGPDEYDFMRRAYFGGRVQLYRHDIVPIVNSYDVSSMYPWAVRTVPLPRGRRKSVRGPEARMAYNDQKPGVYDAIVEVPKLHLPPLPYRYKKDTSVGYPYGTFRGTWTQIELEYAESVGCSVYVQKGLVWERAERFFTPWVDKIWALRSDKSHGGKSSGIGTFMKFYANSLTGKLGSNPMKTKFVVNPREIKTCRCKCLICGETPNGHRNGGGCEFGFTITDCKCGAHYQVSEKIFGSDHYRLDRCGHVHWSAYLTSRARIELNTFQRADSTGEGLDMVYSDTDSAYCIEKRTRNVGDDLGQWQFQCLARNFEGFAPKCYTYETIIDKDGEQRILREAKAKGISIDKYNKEMVVIENGQRRLVENPRAKQPKTTLEVGERYSKTGVVGVGAGVRDGSLFNKVVMSRVLNRQDGDRVKNPDGTTRPQHASDLDGIPLQPETTFQYVLIHESDTEWSEDAEPY